MYCKLSATAACLLVLSAVMAGQATRPEFEVASIKPSPEQTTQINVGVRVSGSQVRISYMSVKDYIAIAYRMRPDQVIGPDWIGQDRYDIAAKIPDGAPEGQVADMLQALLAERFGLTVHRDKKEFPVYALIARPGATLPVAVPDPNAPAVVPGATTVSASGNAGGIGIDLGGGSSFTLSPARVDVKNLSLARMTEMLARFLDRPVVDMTELKGTYDLALDITPEEYGVLMMRSAINAGVNLPPQALRLLDTGPANPLAEALKKYGLGLDSRRAPLDVIVVDTIQKAPTPN